MTEEKCNNTFIEALSRVADVPGHKILALKKALEHLHACEIQTAEDFATLYTNTDFEDALRITNEVMKEAANE